MSSFSSTTRARRHVDAQRQGLGGEDGLDQALDEEFFHDFLEGGQHAGVVGGQAAQQAVPPAPEAEDVQVIRGDVLGGLVDAPGDDALFLLGGQPQPGGDALGHGGVAAGAGEDEGDGGQEVLPVQAGDDLRAAGLADGAALAALRRGCRRPAGCCWRRWLRPPWPKRAAEVHLAFGPRHGQELGVDLEPRAVARATLAVSAVAAAASVSPAGRDFVEGGFARRRGPRFPGPP